MDTERDSPLDEFPPDVVAGTDVIIELSKEQLESVISASKISASKIAYLLATTDCVVDEPIDPDLVIQIDHPEKL